MQTKTKLGILVVIVLAVAYMFVSGKTGTFKGSLGDIGSTTSTPSTCAETDVTCWEQKVQTDTQELEAARTDQAKKQAEVERLTPLVQAAGADRTAKRAAVQAAQGEFNTAKALADSALKNLADAKKKLKELSPIAGDTVLSPIQKRKIEAAKAQVTRYEQELAAASTRLRQASDTLRAAQQAEVQSSQRFTSLQEQLTRAEAKVRTVQQEVAKKEQTLAASQAALAHARDLVNRPDLVIESAHFVQNMQSGEIQYDLSVRNIGAAKEVLNLAVQPLYLNANDEVVETGTSTLISGVSGRYDSAGFWINVESGGVIQARGRNFNEVLPFRLIYRKAGIRFVIDSWNTVPELSETNNSFDVAIPAEYLAWTPPPPPIVMLPDLTFTGIGTTTGLTAGDVYFTGLLKNIGSGDVVGGAGTTSVQYKFCLDEFSPFASPHCEFGAAPLLHSGENTTVTSREKSLTPPFSNRTVHFCADSPSNFFRESDETNNCRSITFSTDQWGLTAGQ